MTAPPPWDGRRQPPPPPHTRQPIPVVTRPAKRTLHGLHALLTFLTCGLWLPVWLITWAVNAWHPANRAKIEYR